MTGAMSRWQARSALLLLGGPIIDAMTAQQPAILARRLDPQGARKNPREMAPGEPRGEQNTARNQNIMGVVKHSLLSSPPVFLLSVQAA